MQKAANLTQYADQNLQAYKEMPFKKSKYTSISKLDAMLSVSQKKIKAQPSVLPKNSAEVFGIEEFAKKFPKELEEALTREEKPKDQYEGYINSHYNCGFVILIEKNAKGTIKIETNLPEQACTKSIIIVPQNAEISIEEHLSGNGKLFAQTVHIKDQAKVAYVRTNSCKENQIIYQQFIAENDATLYNSNVFINKSFMRTNTTNIIEGKGASIRDYSFLLASAKQHMDINYSSVHRQTDGFSHCVFKSVLMDESKNVFDGMIKIEHTADKSNALLECHAMILGSKASSNQIPSLEIKTDDVKATHSATVVRIEEDEIFYLQARGIKKAEAKKIIVTSFLESIVYMLPEQIRKPLKDQIEKNV